jgi:gamma-glutamyl hercynylcysteine S-oxide synthase
VLRCICKLMSAALLVAVFLQSEARGQDSLVRMEGEQIDGPACAGLPEWFQRAQARPCTDAEMHAWLADIRHWRAERRIRVGYDGADYTRPELAWTQSSFIQPQMMVHDRYFYDPLKRRYIVDRYLDDLDRRYGGIDSVLVWPTYPNIGIDDRNQYDLFHDLPGGIEGIRSFVEDFHRRGVKVLFPTMLWDQGTRQEETPDAQALAAELAAVGADGVNGDTLQGIPYTFRKASDDLHHPLALEPELGPASDEMLKWNDMSWGYWKYGFVPTISRYKWIEPRHMVHVSDRWAHDHNDDLQFAFFNGTGFESWENVWGIWNQITPRDAEALRRIALIERSNKNLLVSQQWEPYVPILSYGVFASKWPGETATLWTIVNRNPYPVDGREMGLPHRDGVRYFDLWNGSELKAERQGSEDILSFPVEAGGFGAVLMTETVSQNLDPLLQKMHALSERPLSDYSRQWVPLPQQLVPIAKTHPPKTDPAGMTQIPAADFVFRVNGVEIEGTNDEGVDVQYPTEVSPRRFHELKLHIDPFWIDTYPVTNAEYKQFLDATHYRPADDHNFLKDWKEGTFPPGWGDKPVTWVSIEDARAYAAWAGKRLPREWEWQYAAQGSDRRDYPWGNEWVSANVPTPDTGRVEQPPADVHAHASGASPFGVQDLVGNVWQWTDEGTDEHTRFAILRGGSHYRPEGSRWYFPQAYKLSQHGKYLLMAPSLDRSASIGFRCVIDAR